MEIGTSFTAETVVSADNTATAMGSGTLEVFSTPSMIALAEKAAYSAVQSSLDGGLTTVGTLMNMKHLSATPVGMKVRAEATLTEEDGRRLVFDVKAYDESGLIGEGTHERFIIKSESFLEKTYAKLDNGN